MCRKKVLLVLLVSFTVILGLASSGLCFGKKELETENVAVKLANEVMKGGYRIVKTNELKGWMDQKKDMLIVDTMPFEASYKKNHIPGAAQFLFPIPGRKKWSGARLLPITE